MAEATCFAVRDSLNLSGAISIRMKPLSGGSGGRGFFLAADCFLEHGVCEFLK